MAGEPERRLQKVMDKLYHFPKPKPKPSTSSPVEREKGKELSLRFGVERGSRVPSVASIGMLGPAPRCRPWDRGDLMRRLATFKAMTWFAKPKVINPVNCARRGWINVEVDVIVCEACGARLLFSTPSSWPLQQVEKAASVFSIKLDTGHKLLCPWIDNICEEAQALFPPTPPPALVESYSELSSSLLRLMALPMISSSTIEYMKKRSSQLEEFLNKPSHLSIVLKSGIKLTSGLKNKDLDDVLEDASANLYYQALKVISLCGWEPRVLPYAVDCAIKGDQSTRAIFTSESSEQIFQQQKNAITIYSPNGQDEVEGVECASTTHGDYQCDPASVVLECRFCGACVALWAFTMIERPLQLFNFTADSSNQDEMAAGSLGRVSEVEAPRMGTLGLNLTIAGGPPPTKQNFRPRVSFPVVSRHLRAELSSGRKCLSLESRNPASTHYLPQNNDPLDHQKDIYGSPVISEGAGSLNRKRSRDEFCNSENSNVDAATGSTVELHGSSTSSPYGDRSAVETNHDEQVNFERPTNGVQILPESLPISDATRKGSDKEEASKQERGIEEGTVEMNKIDRSISATSVASSTDKNTGSNLYIPNSADATVNDQKANGFKEKLASSFNKESDANTKSGKSMLYEKMNEFDPIKQHRTFCPWIAPDSETLPGWKLTLSALVSHEKTSTSNSQEDIQTSFLDEVDDPISSIRELFRSPPSKRLRSTH
ncbi:uncharacterized protein [Typha latifolia]|uniref:uncharacterized protein isoform X1 n=1 Tax=Typha latifolia TaxID=4733 RepID=UPI003C2ABADB